MSPFQWLKPMAVAAGVLVAAAACGSSGGGGSTANKGTITVAAEGPLSGTEASQGQPIANGVQLAAQQAGSVKGYNIQVKTFDDAVQGTHDPQKGAQNMQAIAGDSTILGVVGPLNSNVGKAMIPVAAQNSLTLISPANTNECLTRDDLGCAGAASQLRSGKTNSYFRVTTIDTNQGPAMAEYAYNQLHLKKVAVGSDNETYGKGIANSFLSEWQKLGGQVAAHQDFDWKTTDSFAPFLQAAKNAGAQGIYWGGVTATKTCIPRQQMQSVGFTADTPYMGGDGIATDPNCVKAMGAMSPNAYASVASPDAAHLPAAKSMIDAYNKKYGEQNLTGYAVTGYAATQAIINGISKAIDANGGNKPTRQQVRDQVAKTSGLSTVVGSLGFDKYGDNTTKIVSIYKYTSTDPAQAAKTPWQGQYDFASNPPKYSAGA
jgi:branched-chain amino acid transport system substrate-binding protein